MTPVDNPYRDPLRRSAFSEGCTAAASGADRFQATPYPTDGEREAFRRGFDDWWALNAPAVRGSYDSETENT